MGKERVLIIIPAYNEEANILNTYKSIMDYNKEYKTNYKVMVINDGSNDNTENFLQEFNVPHIKLVQNLGIGGAVQTGYKYALENNFDIAIQFDGDGQHNVEYIKDLIAPIINNNVDLTIGSRFLKEGSSKFKSTKIRRMGIKVIAFFIKIFTGRKITDPTSGFRAANKSVIKIFAEDYPNDSPEPISFVKIARMGYKTREVAVSMNERVGGSSSITSNIWKPMYYMVNVCIAIMVTSFIKKKRR